MDEAFRSVTLGDEFLKEWILFAKGVMPASKMFLPTYLSAVLERMWRVLRVHADFEELPTGLQLQIMHTNCLKGMSLVSVRGEHSTGMQQVQNGFGELDEKKWLDKYQKLLLVKGEIKHYSVTHSPALTPDQAAEYKRLITDAKVLMFDPTLFKLNLLLTMTQHNGLPQDNPLSKLHFKYETLLRRRLWWMHTSSKTGIPKSEEFGGDPTQIHARIRSSIQSLERISGFLQIVLQSANFKLP